MDSLYRNSKPHQQAVDMSLLLFYVIGLGLFLAATGAFIYHWDSLDPLGTKLAISCIGVWIAMYVWTKITKRLGYRN